MLRLLSPLHSYVTNSVFGKSRKSCKNLVLRRRKFTRILASLARIAPLKGGRKNFFVWYNYYNIGAAYVLILLGLYTEPKNSRKNPQNLKNYTVNSKKSSKFIETHR